MCYLKRKNANHYILIDKNADKHTHYITRCSQNFTYVKCDILEGNTTDIQADLVVMDPPWYLNYNKLFFQFASSLVAIGGIIICVLPPRYTRVHIDKELKELEYFINDYGIVKESYMRNAVSYDTPPFERNVLRENGIYCMPMGWRTGDILITKKIENRKANQKIVTISENGWEEISIGIVRYKLKTNYELKIETFDLLIESIYNNDIYPSVKRSKTKSEKKINVWTSGNRVFYCTNIQLLYYILMVYSAQYTHYDLNICEKIEWNFCIKLNDEQRSNILKCIKFIEDINKKEYKEYGKWRKL